MAHREGDFHQGDHDTAEEHHHHVRGMFGKVRDSLDVTKHLGFQSGPDSQANSEALARARAGEASRADHEDEEENSSPEAGLGPRDGVAGVADTLAGAVAPKTQSTIVKTSSEEKPARPHGPPAPELMRGNEGESVVFEKSLPHPNSSDVEHKTSPVKQESEKSKESEGGWGSWVAHKVHSVSRGVASKELSDELLKKESKAKEAK